MEAHVITLCGNPYSVRVAQRCKDTANIQIETFPAVTAEESGAVMDRHGLEWTWGTDNVLKHHSYGGNHAARVGCAMSHYLLWLRCAELQRPMLILEHDAVFIAPFEDFEFSAVCQINDPRGATPRGDWWSDVMASRGPGVFQKTRVLDDPRPDGLAGNSAYVIKPHAAERLIDLYRTIGVWPNDATMCRQLVDGLEERYPFITRVEPEMSTI